MIQAPVQTLPGGVFTIDTGYQRPGFAASHLIVSGGRGALVDVGTHHSVPRLLAALEVCGLGREEVDYVLLTHVHLDHAGGAGALLRQLPRARLVVHPRGAPHMIDPARLTASATAVYGEARFREEYGTLVPVPAARVRAVEDGSTLRLGERELLFLDTPGHARHHVCIYDAHSRGVFSGDTFGLSYRDFDSERGAFIFPSTSPVQFDHAAMHASIDRLVALHPRCFYLTHYGRVDNSPGLAAGLRRRLDHSIVLARRAARAGTAQEAQAALVAALGDYLMDEISGHGCGLSREQIWARIALDVTLNAQGLLAYLEREARA
ncbi:MAG TPA: MBL fold metallo-hydrolase [Gammaproteobacteria bacterium]|nr:MBL fold metallo-hydrolase [Gammaproteobacteria bacterium]